MHAAVLSTSTPHRLVVLCSDGKSQFGPEQIYSVVARTVVCLQPVLSVSEVLVVEGDLTLALDNFWCHGSPPWMPVTCPLLDCALTFPVPELELLLYLPSILDGLFNMLRDQTTDKTKGIRQVWPAVVAPS